MAIKKEFYVKLENWLKSSEPFSLDTNVIIDLIKENKFSILTTIARAKNYVLTQTVASELLGLCRSEILNFRGIQQITSFIRFCKEGGKLARINTSSIERTLAPLANLLPRKIVTDVVIGDKDSFVNGLIDKYAGWIQYMREAKKLTIDYKQIANEYAEEKSKLFSKCIDKFERHLKQNKITLDEDVKDRFDVEIKKMLSGLMAEVEGIIGAELKKSGRIIQTLDTIRMKLQYYSTKQYAADVRIVSQAIANGATFSSFDSDVIFLMTLYSAANAA